MFPVNIRLPPSQTYYMPARGLPDISPA